MSNRSAAVNTEADEVLRSDAAVEVDLVFVAVALEAVRVLNVVTESDSLRVVRPARAGGWGRWGLTAAGVRASEVSTVLYR